MKCPRCQSTITATPDPEGFLTCPGCGARLRSRSAPATVGAVAARRGTPLGARPEEIQGVLTRLDPDDARSGGGQFPDGTNPNATLPPGTPLPRIPRPGSPEARALAERMAAERPAPPPVRVTRAPGTTMEALMAEVQALRRLQEETLELLRAGGFASAERERSMDVADELGLPVPPALRARHRKTVLLVDDDAHSRRSAEAALDAAEIPVRGVSDGHAALGEIAGDKPDVIVVELDMAGSMSGRDLITMVRAAAEWADIPILLYTRSPISGQEARSSHGADDYVPKQSGAEALVSRVVTLFRRG
jgi:CheY-like chemotaxis protein